MREAFIFIINQKQKGGELKMKKLILLLTAALFLFAGVAQADWTTGDPYKMHFPQLPDEEGWDVDATAWWVDSDPDYYVDPLHVLADDFECAETGWIQDIHFWGSWYQGVTGNLIGFQIGICGNIPADPPDIPYSKPDNSTILADFFVDIADIEVDSITSVLFEGFYYPDPLYPFWFEQDHNQYFQYNIFLPEELWIEQTAEEIYWLYITAIVEYADPYPRWGWKSSTDHWEDNAVYADLDELFWIDLWEPPEFTQSLDLAFVITGEAGITVPICRADFNGSQRVGTDDVGILIDEWMWGIPDPCDPTDPAKCCKADANGDNKVNTGDIGILIEEWMRMDCPWRTPPCTEF